MPYFSPTLQATLATKSGILVTEDLTAQVNGTTGQEPSPFTLASNAVRIVMLADAGRAVPPSDITAPGGANELALSYNVPAGHELIVVYEEA